MHKMLGFQKPGFPKAGIKSLLAHTDLGLVFDCQDSSAFSIKQKA